MDRAQCVARRLPIGAMNAVRDVRDSRWRTIGHVMNERQDHGREHEGAEARRYDRQIRLKQIGAVGQERLGAARALVIGCGALGCGVIDGLARAGVEQLTLIDRDIVEWTNLQRQSLYAESDAGEGVPKAIAAARRVAMINRRVRVDARVADFGAFLASELVPEHDVIIDGLDNFETRYLLNDASVRYGVPYIYGGAVATGGMRFTVLPIPEPGEGRPWTRAQAGPCLRCLFPEPPPAGTSPTCDTVGVLGPIVATIAALQVAEAIKVLVGDFEALDRSILSLDLWSNELRRFDVSTARSESCPCCAERCFDHLNGERGLRLSALCGQAAVQVAPGIPATSPSLLQEVRSRLSGLGEFALLPYLLRGSLTGELDTDGRPIELTLFPDGRALFRGSLTMERARGLYSRYVGS